MDAFSTPPQTPDALLDAIRDQPERPDAWRDRQFERLISRFPPEQLADTARRRLDSLGGADGAIILRLVEALASPELLESLAEALLAQPDLPAESAYPALDLLRGADLFVAYPELAERWEDLDETLDDAGSLEMLAEQLEDEPEGSWVALQGLGAVEPEVRAEIIAGLARGPLGPGLISFLRLLAFSQDPATRAAALQGLAGRSEDHPALHGAWASIAADHPDPDVVSQALRRLGPGAGGLPTRPLPRLIDGRVTAIDGHGRGYVVLAAQDRGRPVACAFLCDAQLGIREVIGHEGPADPFLAKFAGRPGRDALANVPDLALGLLGGALLFSGPVTTPALRYWLERTAGPSFRPRPFSGPFGDDDPAEVPPTEAPERARDVLASCPTWVDDSDLTYELAEEIELREGAALTDPRRDAGAYRFLFEHHLLERLELYRRMLFWMAAFWHAGGDPDLGLSALSLAWQLSDPQHAVPAHPFTVVLTTRSLDVARANLRRGIDLRDPATRARLASGAMADA